MPNCKHAFTAYGIAFALSIDQHDDAEMLLACSGLNVEKGKTIYKESHSRSL